MVSATHGWWQACDALGLPGYDATSADGANMNAVIGNREVDPISGSVPHRSYLCEVTRLTGGAQPTKRVKVRSQFAPRMPATSSSP